MYALRGLLNGLTVTQALETDGPASAAARPYQRGTVPAPSGFVASIAPNGLVATLARKWRRMSAEARATYRGQLEAELTYVTADGSAHFVLDGLTALVDQQQARMPRAEGNTEDDPPYLPDGNRGTARYSKVDPSGQALRRARPGHPDAAPPRAALTGRQREILVLVAAGRTNQEIATLLGISVRTVEKHLDNLRTVYGPGSRWHLVSAAEQDGAIPVTARPTHSATQDHRGSQPASPAADPSAPTARQQQILALVDAGLTNHEIAATLDISKRTVEKHLDNLRKLYGSGSRARLVAVAEKEGALPRAGDSAEQHRWTANDPNDKRSEEPRARPSAPTARQLDILALVAAGRTTREIAAILGITGQTVKAHLDNAREVYGPGSRAQLAAIAAKNGDLPWVALSGSEHEFLEWYRARRADRSGRPIQSLADYAEMNFLEPAQLHRWLEYAGIDPNDNDTAPVETVPRPDGDATTWHIELRRFLATTPAWMDELVGAAPGTWEAVERGERDLEVRHVRAALRRIPGARALYRDAARLYPALLTTDGAPAYPEGYSRIGDYLEFRRKSHDLKRSQLAGRLKKGKNTVSRWESGESRPAKDDVAALLEATATEDDIFYDDISECYSHLPRGTILYPSPFDSESLGAYLRHFRHVNKLSWSEVGNAFGVSAGAVQSLETGVRDPLDLTVVRIYRQALHRAGRWNDLATAWGLHHLPDLDSVSVPHPTDFYSIHDWIRSVRIFRGIPPLELARRIGKSDAWVGFTEDNHKPGVEDLRRIRDALEIPNDTLVSALLTHYSRTDVEERDPEEERLFWDLIATRPGSAEEKHIRNKIFERYARLADEVATRRSIPAEHRNEYAQQAAIAILLATRNFVPPGSFFPAALMAAHYSVIRTRLELRYPGMKPQVQSILAKVDKYIRTNRVGTSTPGIAEISSALNLTREEVITALPLLRQVSKDAAVEGRSGPGDINQTDESQFTDVEFADKFDRALSGLEDPGLAKRIVFMVRSADLSTEQAAARLGITTQLVDKYLAEAEERIRAAFADEFGMPDGLRPTVQAAQQAEQSQAAGEQHPTSDRAATSGTRIDPVAIDLGDSDEPDTAVQRARQGDTTAFNELRERYGRASLREVLARLGVPASPVGRDMRPLLQVAQELNRMAFRVAEAHRWRADAGTDPSVWLHSIVEGLVDGWFELNATQRKYVTEAVDAMRRGATISLVQRGALNRLVDAGERVLADAETHATDSSQQTDSGLTNRQFTVLELMAAGMTSPEIAEELRLSPGTVSIYATQIRQKLGARTRAEAVYIALSTGILPGSHRADDETPGREDLHLTSHEIHVLGRIANGDTSDDIAQDLEISPRSVDQLVGRVGRKLGARNRPGIVAAAARTGDLPLADPADAVPGTGRMWLADYEINVVTRIANGETSKDIAQALGLSSLTVDEYLMRVCRKLRVHNRAAMIAVAIRTGLLPGTTRTAVEVPELSTADIDLLTRIANGETNTDIAGDLQISASAVDKALARVREKLGTRNRPQTVAVAIHAGILPGAETVEAGAAPPANPAELREQHGLDTFGYVLSLLGVSAKGGRRSERLARAVQLALEINDKVFRLSDSSSGDDVVRRLRESAREILEHRWFHPLRAKMLAVLRSDGITESDPRYGRLAELTVTDLRGYLDQIGVTTRWVFLELADSLHHGRDIGSLSRQEKNSVLRIADIPRVEEVPTPDDSPHTVFGASRTGRQEPEPTVPDQTHSGTAHPGITDRETTVLALVAKGHSHRDIATALALSDREVGAAVRSMAIKLGTPHWAEMLEVARRRGIEVNVGGPATPGRDRPRDDAAARFNAYRSALAHALAARTGELGAAAVLADATAEQIVRASHQLSTAEQQSLAKLPWRQPIPRDAAIRSAVAAARRLTSIVVVEQHMSDIQLAQVLAEATPDQLEEALGALTDRQQKIIRAVFTRRLSLETMVSGLGYRDEATAKSFVMNTVRQLGMLLAGVAVSTPLINAQSSGAMPFGREQHRAGRSAVTQAPPGETAFERGRREAEEERRAAASGISEAEIDLLDEVLSRLDQLAPTTGRASGPDPVAIDLGDPDGLDSGSAESRTDGHGVTESSMQRSSRGSASVIDENAPAATHTPADVAAVLHNSLPGAVTQVLDQIDVELRSMSDAERSDTDTRADLTRLPGWVVDRLAHEAKAQELARDTTTPEQRAEWQARAERLDYELAHILGLPQPGTGWTDRISSDPLHHLRALARRPDAPAELRHLVDTATRRLNLEDVAAAVEPLHRALADWPIAEHTERAAAIAWELASQARSDGGGAPEISAAIHGQPGRRWIEIHVSDDSRTLPARESGDRPGWRAVDLLDTHTETWGWVLARNSGKQVWFKLFETADTSDPSQPPHELILDLPIPQDSLQQGPSLARRAVRQRLRQAGHPDPSDLTVLVSDLVQNVYRYADQGDARVRIRLDGNTVRIGITDASRGLPARHEATTQGTVSAAAFTDDHAAEWAETGIVAHTHGFFLGMLEAMASSWGVILERAGGKTIWFEVPMPPPRGSGTTTDRPPNTPASIGIDRSAGDRTGLGQAPSTTSSDPDPAHPNDGAQHRSTPPTDTDRQRPPTPGNRIDPVALALEPDEPETPESTAATHRAPSDLNEHDPAPLPTTRELVTDSGKLKTLRQDVDALRRQLLELSNGRADLSSAAAVDRLLGALLQLGREGKLNPRQARALPLVEEYRVKSGLLDDAEQVRRQNREYKGNAALQTDQPEDARPTGPDPVPIDLGPDENAPADRQTGNAESSDTEQLQALRAAVAGRLAGTAEVSNDPVLNRAPALIDELVAARRRPEAQVPAERLRLLEQFAHQLSAWLARADEAAEANAAYEQGLREGTPAVLRARQDAAEIRLGSALAAVAEVRAQTRPRTDTTIVTRPADHLRPGETERLGDVAETIFGEMVAEGAALDAVNTNDRQQLAEATRRYDELRDMSQWLEELLTFAEQPNTTRIGRERLSFLLDHFRAISDLLAATEFRNAAAAALADAADRERRLAQAAENYGMADHAVRNIAEMLGEPRHRATVAPPAALPGAPVVWPGADGQPDFITQTRPRQPDLTEPGPGDSVSPDRTPEDRAAQSGSEHPRGHHVEQPRRSDETAPRRYVEQNLTVEDLGTVAAASDRGGHAHNEDAFALIRVQVGGEEATALIVNDGLSRPKGGHRASAAANAAARDFVVAALRRADRDGRIDPVAVVEGAVAAAQEAVLALPPESSADKPPATTIVVALMESGRLTVDWVGDSRAYWIPLDGGPPIQLTRDDSKVQDVLDVFEDTTREEAEHSAIGGPGLTHNLGRSLDGLKPREKVRDLRGDGVVLALTDGVWEPISPDDPDPVAAIVRRSLAESPGDLGAVTRALVRAGIEAGTADDVTAAAGLLSAAKIDTPANTAADHDGSATLADRGADPVAIDLDPDEADPTPVGARQPETTPPRNPPDSTGAPPSPQRGTTDEANTADRVGTPWDSEPLLRQVLEQHVANGRPELATALLRQRFETDMPRLADNFGQEAAHRIADEVCATAIARLGQLGNRNIELWLNNIAREIIWIHRQIAGPWSRIRDFVFECARLQRSDPLARLLTEAGLVDVHRELTALPSHRRDRLIRTFWPAGSSASPTTADRIEFDRDVLWIAARQLAAAVAAAANFPAQLPDRAASSAPLIDRLSSPTPTTSSPWLTSRELEVLNLIYQGLTYAEIGRRLAVDTKAVTNYQRSAAKKFGTAGAIRTVLEAKRQGFVHDGDRPPAGTVRLSREQRQLLQLMADGRTDQAIAEVLGVATLTVKRRRAQIGAVLGETKRTLMLMKAVRLGAFEPASDDTAPSAPRRPDTVAIELGAPDEPAPVTPRASRAAGPAERSAQGIARPGATPWAQPIQSETPPGAAAPDRPARTPWQPSESSNNARPNPAASAPRTDGWTPWTSARRQPPEALHRRHPVQLRGRPDEDTAARSTDSTRPAPQSSPGTDTSTRAATAARTGRDKDLLHRMAQSETVDPPRSEADPIEDPAMAHIARAQGSDSLPVQGTSVAAEPTPQSATTEAKPAQSGNRIDPVAIDLGDPDEPAGNEPAEVPAAPQQPTDPPAEKSLSTRELLVVNKTFAHLLLGRWYLPAEVGNIFGTSLATTAAPYALMNAGQSPAAAAIAAAAGWLAKGAEPLAGRTADRSDRRRIMLRAQAIGAAAAATTTGLILFDAPNLALTVAAASLVEGTAATYYFRAFQAVNGDLLLTDAQKRTGNDLRNVTGSTASVTGQALGPGLAGIAPAAPFGLNTLSYLTNWVNIRSLSLPPQTFSAPQSLFRDIAVGARTLWDDKFLRDYTVISAINNAAFAMMGFRTATVVEGSDLGWAGGAVVAAPAIGGIMSGVLSKVTRNVKTTTFYPLALANMAGGFAVQATTTDPAVIAAATFVDSMVMWTMVARAGTHEQKVIPSEMRGRVGGVKGGILNVPAGAGLFVASALIGGAAANAQSGDTVAALAATISAITAAGYGVVLFVRQGRVFYRIVSKSGRGLFGRREHPTEPETPAEPTQIRAEASAGSPAQAAPDAPTPAPEVIGNCAIHMSRVHRALGDDTAPEPADTDPRWKAEDNWRITEETLGAQLRPMKTRGLDPIGIAVETIRNKRNNIDRAAVTVAGHIHYIVEVEGEILVFDTLIDDTDDDTLHVRNYDGDDNGQNKWKPSYDTFEEAFVAYFKSTDGTPTPARRQLPELLHRKHPVQLRGRPDEETAAGSTDSTKSAPRSSPGTDTSARAVAAARTGRGEDLLHRLDYRMAQSEIVDPPRSEADPIEDPAMAYIARAQGFDSLPVHATPEEIDALVAAGDHELFRGVRDPRYAVELRSGRYLTGVPGSSSFGIGIYASTDSEVALGYSDDRSDGVIRMALPRSARTIDFSRLQEEMNAEISALDDEEQTLAAGEQNPEVRARRGELAVKREILSDAGRYAAVRGYDAYYVREDGAADVWVILNRSAVVVAAEPTPQSATTEAKPTPSGNRIDPVAIDLGYPDETTPTREAGLTHTRRLADAELVRLRAKRDLAARLLKLDPGMSDSALLREIEATHPFDDAYTLRTGPRGKELIGDIQRHIVAEDRIRRLDSAATDLLHAQVHAALYGGSASRQTARVTAIPDAKSTAPGTRAATAAARNHSGDRSPAAEVLARHVDATGVERVLVVKGFDDNGRPDLWRLPSAHEATALNVRAMDASTITRAGIAVVEVSERFGAGAVGDTRLHDVQWLTRDELDLRQTNRRVARGFTTSVSAALEAFDRAPAPADATAELAQLGSRLSLSTDTVARLVQELAGRPADAQEAIVGYFRDLTAEFELTKVAVESYADSGTKDRLDNSLNLQQIRMRVAAHAHIQDAILNPMAYEILYEMVRDRNWNVGTVADGIDLLSRPQIAAALREIHQRNAHFAPYIIAGMPIRITDPASFERELHRIAEISPGSVDSRLLDTLDKCFSDGKNGRDIGWDFLSSLKDFSPDSVRQEFADRLLKSGQLSHLPDDVSAEVKFSAQQLRAVEDLYVDGPPGRDFSCYIEKVGGLPSAKRPPTIRAAMEVIRDVTPGFARCIRDLISDNVSETERNTLGLRRTGDAVVHELIEIARPFVTEVKSANISPENLAKVQSSEFLGQLLIIVTRYDSSDWGPQSLTSLRELLRYHEQASAEGRIAPIPAEYQPSSVLEIAKLRSRDSGSGSQWTEDLLTRFERLAKNLLDARSALTSAHRPLTYLLGKIGRDIVEYIEELDRCIVSDTLADGSPMNDKARRNMVARVHELKELITSEAGGSQQFPALRSLENFEQNFQRLVHVGKLHDDLRTICFAWAMQQHPVWIDRLKSLRPGEPTLEDVVLVRDFVDHTTNQEVFGRYFSSRKIASKFRRMTNISALEEAILRVQGVGVSSDTTRLQFVPTRGQLLELSGNIASACWAGRYPSVAEAMQNMTAVIMVRNPDDPVRTAFAGACLLLETRSETGEPILLIRGLNPVENYINHVSVADFYRKFMDWAQEVATARGCRLAIVIDDHSGGAATNRPVLFDHLTAERKKMKRIRIDSGNTTFNGYNVADCTYLFEPPEPPSTKPATVSIPTGEQPRSTDDRTDPVAIDLGGEESEALDPTSETTASSSGPSRTTYDTVPLPGTLVEPADDIALLWPEVDSRGWIVLPGTGPDKQPYHTSDPEIGDPFILLADGKFVTADASHEDLLSALLAQGVSLEDISGFGWWRVSGRVKGLDAFSQGFEEWNGDPMNPAQILDALANSRADLSVCEFDTQFGSEHQGLMWRGAAAEMPLGPMLRHEGDAYKLLSGYSSADDGAGNRVVFWIDLVAWEATAEGHSFTIRVNAARSEPAEGTITVHTDGDSVAAHYTAFRSGRDRARAAAAWSVVHDKFTSWLTDSGASWAMGSETAPTEDIPVASTRPATVAESAQRSERIIRAEPEGRYSPNAASEAASWLAGQLDGWPVEQVNLACAELTAMVTDAAEHRRGRIHLVAETTDDRLRVTLLDTHAASMPRNARGGIPTRSGLAVLPGPAAAGHDSTPMRAGVELFKRHEDGWRQAIWFELRSAADQKS
ncbi:MFS transporter [Nocardia niwae]|uniref:MFS transporter n=1 Tax=Nocardia niwae TaxID=626084 RepID=UPI00340A927D